VYASLFPRGPFLRLTLTLQGEILQQGMASGDDVIGESIQQQIVIRASEFTWKAGENYEEATAVQRKTFKFRVQEELCFRNGRLNLITGPTGCGKTSLLMSLLGRSSKGIEWTPS
jgi:ABC-type transport system involved in cytochrome bd biosynthesis fused ATPase/permease subunit